MEKVKMEKAKVERARVWDRRRGARILMRKIDLERNWTLWQLGDECNYSSWFDEEEGTKWQRRALIEAHDEIRQKTRVIEQLIKTISKMKSNLETKETVDDENEDEIVRKFKEFYV
ncbi:hypothetical protein IGI04_034395 [Brassica rapa subsp. trilocularis]|uniref:Uncharacterized protein n=1 Tax=Brassica rapa subsp. trilocularis TaxID=1813537 RepID=A0ABQ7LAK8_BRACM|nr:hypothetical protein IGI04_034395 [Brassica rapa subsp. trilocularis]